MGERGNVCAGCGVSNELWCPKCQAEVVKITPPYCRRCGYPSQTTLCKDCRYHEPWFDQARSWARYGGALRSAILKLKHQEDQKLVQIFAKELLAVLWFMSWEFDCIVPVPLATNKYQLRGFNQAELLARELATLSGSKYEGSLLLRSQNARFHSVKWDNQDASFLLLDDVYTTGATANAASRALKRSGVGRVFVLTLARSLVNAKR